MHFPSRIGFLAVLFILILSSPVRGAVASPTLPLDSWVYPALDKLSALGLIESALQGSRPYARSEAARQVREALDRSNEQAVLPVAEEMLERLQAEFSAELGEITYRDRPGYWKPLRELEVAGIYRDGEDSVFPAAGIDAQQFPLNTNNYDLEYEDGANLQAILSTDARFLGRFLLEWRPVALISEDGDLDFQTLTGRAAVGLGPVVISAGRQALWWGQGRHGSLVLTNNAQPLDMLRVTNPSPVLLPWFLRYLGPFRVDMFWSELEEDRHVPEPYFAGLRFNIKPVPWMEIGASRTIMFGGEGRPDVDFGEFLTILSGKNLNGDEDTSNQLAAIDLRLRLPFLWNTELYGEWGGEDEANGLPANESWMAGVYIPQLDPSGRTSLRLEYADLSFVDDNSPVWYRHGIYRSGYTYKEKILGHHTGGASWDLSGELAFRLSGGSVFSMLLDYERRGEDQPVSETHLQPGISLEWVLSAHRSLTLDYTLDQVSNFGYVQGDDRTFHFARMGLIFNW